MKPELTTMSPGRHNENIEESFSRILQGATWKRQRVVVIIPAGADMPVKVAFAQWSLIFPPNQAVFRMLAQGMEVGEAYTQAIEAVLQHPELSTWEYILTIEHDNMPPVDGLLTLIRDMQDHPEFDCIGGLYWTKGESGVPQIWGDPQDPVLNFRPQPPRVGEVQECNGTGMGFNLWRVSLFKDDKLRKPWFRTVAGTDGVGTQDLHFWTDAKKFGKRCAIDNRVLVGHYEKERDIIW